MDTVNLEVEYKSAQSISILSEHSRGKMNLVRIKFLGLFICALCKVQTVCFGKPATALETNATALSSLRCIQRFMANYLLDTDLTAKPVFNMLPHEPPCRLTVDRTNWKFGETDINIPALTTAYRGVAFLVPVIMLDRAGNSDTRERIETVNRHIRLFGRQTVDCLPADREFAEKDRIACLNPNQTRYPIRIRENFYVDDPRTGKQCKAFWMFSDLKCGQCRVYTEKDNFAASPLNPIAIIEIDVFKILSCTFCFCCEARLSISVFVSLIEISISQRMVYLLIMTEVLMFPSKMVVNKTTVSSPNFVG